MFIIQYILHPRSVGAVKASSGHLAKKMIEDVDFAKAECIVELGAGTGVFTEQIVGAKKKETLFLIFEINDAFYKKLRRKYKNTPNVHVIHNSAEYLGRYLKKCNVKKADAIISGLPFASLPAEVSDRILNACRRCLKAEGSFITFQYTKLKVALLRRFFSRISMKKENRNVPPAYVIRCRV